MWAIPGLPDPGDWNAYRYHHLLNARRKTTLPVCDLKRNALEAFSSDESPWAQMTTIGKGAEVLGSSGKDPGTHSGSYIGAAQSNEFLMSGNPFGKSPLQIQ